ncbi:GNAT family N-acetyltransferase [Vallitalea pronyensis]|uniref:GNAT family N-acetyltransferase n=1 Tax=Vallitalea pronyensis TaxID=1348613 RepID=A0A8J8MLW5_9FIRM|nr:GNAT family N-acetyltransferase [Vallitalea pronyensis]QUI24155.1 GNAT family N-acetyltransferase [Vallitalea pronyensis]
MELVRLNIDKKHELLKLWEVAFEEDEIFEDSLCEQFFSQLDLWHYTYGWLHKDKLVSTYMTLDVDVRIRNKVLKAHYIDGIATLPTYRRQGLVHKQMYEDAMRCREHHIPIMLVDPSRDSFYRKFGFEFAMDKYKILLDRDFFQTNALEKTGNVVKGQMDNNELKQAYQFINQWLWQHSRYNEMLWPPCYEDIKYKRDDYKLAVAHNDDGKPIGYIIYAIHNQEIVIESIRYVTLGALYVLKHYMLNIDEEISTYVLNSIPQDFPLDLFLKDIGRPEKRLKPYSCMTRMMRIVDFQVALEALIIQKPEIPICMAIEDTIIKENSGFYTLLPSGRIIRKSCECFVSSTIEDIVPLLSGLKSAETLYYNGKIRVNDVRNVEQNIYKLPRIIKVLDSILPKVTTYNADEYLAP